MKAMAAALLVGIAGCAPSGPLLLGADALQTYPDARDMPADVQHFIVQWQDCAHWLGEPAWDGARRRQIEQAVAEACPGVDARGIAVRARHAGNAAVIARIAGYEPLGQ
ncbi:MAG: hypothetical protein ACXWUN_11105 [Allosphingosinicella sp.]